MSSSTKLLNCATAAAYGLRMVNLSRHVLSGFMVALALLSVSVVQAQSRSQSVDYLGLGVHWNGSNWISDAAGYGSVLLPSTSTGNFTLYSTGNAASAGLTTTPTTVMTISSAGTVSATQFVGYTGSFGNLTATGTISAAALTVNGVAVTGGSGGGTSDRIVSGTTSLMAYTASGLISITQAGTDTGYFHPQLGLVTIGISSTGTISGTNAYFSGTVSATAVQVGNSSTCGSANTGTIRYNPSNAPVWQYCNGSTWLPFESTAAITDGSGNGFVQVAVGGSHACGRVAAGKIYCWGYNAYGQVGRGDITTPANSPTLVAGGWTNWTALTAGYYHTCGIRGGAAYCWGQNSYGQVGRGDTTTPVTSPTLVAGGWTDWTAISSYSNSTSTCGIRTLNLYCWGTPVTINLFTPTNQFAGQVLQ